MRRIKMLLLLLVLFSSFAHAIKIQVEGEDPNFLERIYQHNNIKNPPKDPRYHWYHGKLETNETRQARWDKARKADPIIRDFTDKMMLKSDWEEERMWIIDYEHPFLTWLGIISDLEYSPNILLYGLFQVELTKKQEIMIYSLLILLFILKIFPKNFWAFLIFYFIICFFISADFLLGPVGALLLYIAGIIVRLIVGTVKKRRVYAAYNYSKKR